MTKLVEKLFEFAKNVIFSNLILVIEIYLQITKLVKIRVRNIFKRFYKYQMEYA